MRNYCVATAMNVSDFVNGRSSMASRSQGSGGHSAAAVSALIAQAREQEASAVTEGERLEGLVARQESLITGGAAGGLCTVE
jgi:hypothetical protein